MFIAVILISGYLAVLVVISIPKQLAEISAARREFTRQLGKPEADNVIRDAISCKLARTYKGNTKTDAAAPKSATTKDECLAVTIKYADAASRRPILPTQQKNDPDATAVHVKNVAEQEALKLTKANDEIRRLKCSNVADTTKLVEMQKHLAVVEVELDLAENLAQQEALNASINFKFGATVFENFLKLMGSFQKIVEQITFLELELDSITDVAEQETLKLANANDELYELNNALIEKDAILAAKELENQSLHFEIVLLEGALNLDSPRFYDPTHDQMEGPSDNVQSSNPKKISPAALRLVRAQIAGNPPGPPVVDTTKLSTDIIAVSSQINQSANDSPCLTPPSPATEKIDIKENSVGDSLDSEPESIHISKPKRARGKRGGKEQRKRDEKKAAKEQALRTL